MHITHDIRLLAGNSRRAMRGAGSWFAHITDDLRQAWAAHRKRRAFIRGARELRRFSDRELWDIGLSRADIDAIERGYFRRD